MGCMFVNSKKVESLDLNTFITSSVNNIPYMFCYCINLTSINVSSFDLSSVEYAEDIFD